MHCYTEVGSAKALASYEHDTLNAAKRLGKGKSGDGRLADGKDEVHTSNNYTLPDGSKIDISNADKARAPEILFRPSLIGLEYPGIHELVVNCIKACDIDLRTALQSSVIVAGSTTLMKSFCQRLHKSIQNLFPKNNARVTLMVPVNRQYSCWIGGSTISELKAFDRMWISKQQMESDGRILSLNCM